MRCLAARRLYNARDWGFMLPAYVRGASANDLCRASRVHCSVVKYRRCFAVFIPQGHFTGFPPPMRYGYEATCHVHVRQAYLVMLIRYVMTLTHIGRSEP